ncbi:MAG: tetratricopeptide repeat protein, partial [Spirochaetota bacterium]
IRFKKGFIYYMRQLYMDALIEFYTAAGAFSDNRNLMFATANTLFKRNDFFAAQGYYNHLLDILELEKSRIKYLLLEERKDHLSLIQYLMKVYNNLGVTLNKLSERSGDPEKYSLGLVYLTRSTEYSDTLTRNPETLERTEAMNMALLNTRGVFYPRSGFELQIYNNIPRDLEELLF